MLIAPFALLLALSDTPAIAADASSAVAATPDTVAAALVMPDPAVDPAAAQAKDDGKKKKADSGKKKKDKKVEEGLYFTWGDHPRIGAGKWLKLDFSTKIQVDKMKPGDDPYPFDDFILRRARIGVDGELFKKLQFSIERELTSYEVKVLAESTKTNWRDLYAELNVSDGVQIRGGRFKIPFGRDQLDGEGSNDFVYRSLGGHYLTPGRDNGGMVHGRFFKRSLNYWVGGFAHDGDNARSNKQTGGDLTFAGRVTGTPLYNVKALRLNKAELGLDFATTQVSDAAALPNGLRARTAVSDYTFFEEVYVKGTRRRYGADVEWSDGPFGLRTEYMRVTEQRINQGLYDNTVPDLRDQAWYVSGVWVLTGEKADKSIRPKNPLPPHGLGAFELAGRYERIWFNSEQTGAVPYENSRAEVILQTGNRVLTLGANWVPNRWVKVQLNGIHQSLENKNRTPLADGGLQWWSGVLRFQIAL